MKAENHLLTSNDAADKFARMDCGRKQTRKNAETNILNYLRNAGNASNVTELCGVLVLTHKKHTHASTLQVLSEICSKLELKGVLKCTWDRHGLICEVKLNGTPP